jgi:serine/threonine protein kinase
MRWYTRVRCSTCQKLQAAHEADRLHTDLKLTNLMLTHNGNVKVLDFGLARFKSLWQPLAGTRPSTVRHFSPEHVNCTPLRAASDLFSLGSLLHELITGSAPFAGASLHEMCAAIACDHPASLAPYAARYELVWLNAIEKLLDKDLTRRTPTAHALLMELHQPLVTSVRRFSAPVRQTVRLPQTANDDWRMVADFSKGFWQFVFNAGPATLCLALVILAVIGVGSRLFTLVASAH